LREEARALYIAIASALAELATEAGAYDAAIRYRLRILDRDEYDEGAHLALVTTLAAGGHHGDARRAYRRYVACMEELGVEPAPFPAARKRIRSGR
jgi:DNA-binding SARP family transcriptional activator